MMVVELHNVYHIHVIKALVIPRGVAWLQCEFRLDPERYASTEASTVSACKYLWSQCERPRDFRRGSLEVDIN